MTDTRRRAHLLQLVSSSAFLVFITIVYAMAVEAQRRVMVGTMTSIAGGVTWVEYYPEWFFQVLALLGVTTLVILSLTVTRLLGKPYPNQGQLASWKTSLVTIFLLNVLFLGTSHVISYPPFPLHGAYNATVALLCGIFGLGLQQFYDLASALLVAITAVSAFLRYRRLGLGGMLLKVAQVVSLIMLPLGLEIFAFDNLEWDLHVTQFQAAYGIIPWFTNADLFFTSLLLFVSATILTMALPNVRLVLEQAKRKEAHQG